LHCIEFAFNMADNKWFHFSRKKWPQVLVVVVGGEGAGRDYQEGSVVGGEDYVQGLQKRWWLKRG
jgi:hypothetical protein